MEEVTPRLVTLVPDLMSLSKSALSSVGDAVPDDAEEDVAADESDSCCSFSASRLALRADVDAKSSSADAMSKVVVICGRALPRQSACSHLIVCDRRNRRRHRRRRRRRRRRLRRYGVALVATLRDRRRRLLRSQLRGKRGVAVGPGRWGMEFSREVKLCIPACTHLSVASNLSFGSCSRTG